MDFGRTFLEAFIPLFVSIDAFGMVPLFLAVTGHLTPQRQRELSFEAVLWATAFCLGFMLLGSATFQFLGISGADFKIAGGVLLLVLAVVDLIITGKPAVHESEMVGIVPLAMPLIAGPATLTNILVLVSNPKHGYTYTALSLAMNFMILLAVLLLSTRIARLVGINTLRAFSKVVMILLAAFAVNLIRTGILDSIAEFRQ